MEAKVFEKVQRIGRGRGIRIRRGGKTHDGIFWPLAGTIFFRNYLYSFLPQFQVEKYAPKPVEDGIIPKNDYGNVYLYQEWMMPPNCVQLRLQKLDRVAKKLGIDCAPAMVSH